ncbi:mRNA-decapping enzyme 1B isoform X1 [Anoplophora glabripennis]|uniref:mRNA-decapping enzyme 1B isoform X1 n=1 Tax=Anoplophora glabripennis TaxID=217634 RepID=UPI0008757ADF|nr:mRNA-decapping enzyme 1B isoform X1 [Anoplophora glabripennis]
MADSVELRMSVTSIKRVDPYVKDILASATQVALYIFNISTNEWEKTDTEGALFIYRRNGEPFHSIMIVNRRNTNNVIEPIVKEFDYQMQVPFLLYRNSKNKIFGIWFFNREECIRITFLLESLMEGLKDKTDEKSKRKSNNVDIFSMLSKAQENFNKTPSKQDGPPTFSSTPRVPDGTSQSVMDFFAKASTKSTKKPSVPGENGENVLQRLMSNPAHSVEHIEKQQRSITPHEQVNARQKFVNSDRRSVPISFPGTSTGDKRNQSENGISLVNPLIQGPSPLSFLLQSQAQAQSEKEEPLDLLGTSPFAQFLDSSQKPHLMTPMMFTTTKPKEKVDNTPYGSFVDDKQEQVDLLTEKQLAQALIYLLKNNTEFTKQIHEAYVQSIMQRVNLNSNT